MISRKLHQSAMAEYQQQLEMILLSDEVNGILRAASLAMPLGVPIQPFY